MYPSEYQWSCLCYAGPSGPPRRLQSILKSSPSIMTATDISESEPLASTPNRPRVTYASWESYSTDTDISRGQSAGQASLLIHGSQNASFANDADDASAPLGFARSMPRGQPAGQASLLMHGSRNASFANDANDASAPLGFARSMPRQVSMPNNTAHKQRLLAASAVSASSVQYAQQLDHTALRFSSEADGSEWDSGTALAVLAEGQARCAVTGDAFEHLLQCEDLSALETIMRNAVVFARMKPHQKGQVMDLLNIRGLYQMHKGQVRHIQVSSAFNPTATFQKLFLAMLQDCGFNNWWQSTSWSGNSSHVARLWL